jgi:hypothetical protein
VQAILAPCREFLWEASPRGAGLLVHNAHTGAEMRVWIVIIRLIEDSAGLPKPMCCHKQPAYIGEHFCVITCLLDSRHTPFVFHGTKQYQAWHIIATSDKPKYQLWYKKIPRPRCVPLVQPRGGACGENNLVPVSTGSST